MDSDNNYVYSSTTYANIIDENNQRIVSQAELCMSSICKLFDSEFDSGQKNTSSVIWHGINEHDKCIIREIFQKAQSTDRQSKSKHFPDFIYPGFGYIEHFQVSASEGKNPEFFKLRDDAEKSNKISMNVDTPGIRFKDISYDKFGYQYFKESFERLWKKHIKSLSNALVEKQVSGKCIFLVDYNELSLSMQVTTSESARRLLYKKIHKLFPYLWKLQFYSNIYRPVFDRNILKFINGNCNGINFVAFTDRQSFIDIVNTKYIRDMILLLNEPNVRSNTLSVKCDTINGAMVNSIRQLKSTNEE